MGQFSEAAHPRANDGTFTSKGPAAEELGVQLDAAAEQRAERAAQRKEDRERKAAYEVLPHEIRSEIRVTRRPRGRHPVRGMGKVPDGFNVDCSFCFREGRRAHEAGVTRISPTATTWYTNEGGAAAKADANRAMQDHAIRHGSGELPSPPRAAQ